MGLWQEFLLVVNMEIIDVIPNKSVGKVEFGCDRNLVRKEYGINFQEIKKSVFSKNTIDVYDNYHFYYSNDNKLDAIEMFGNIQVIVKGVCVFPGKVSEITQEFPKMQRNDCSWIDKANSLAITVSQDDQNVIDSIFFGKENYFS